MKKLVLSLATLLSACGDPPWAGSYTAASTWNISGPLAGGRTVGDAFADLLVEQIIGASPVPGFLEEDAISLTSSLISDDVKTAIDSNAPPELQPGGSITVALGASLAAIDVTSEVVLEGDEDDIEGTETIQQVSFDVAGRRISLAPADLGGAGVKMEAEWTGEEDDGALAIEPHPYPLYYGELVKRVALEVVDVAGLDDVETGIVTALDCDTITLDILDGNPSIEIEVASFEHTVSASDLMSACASVLSVLEGRVLGVFSIDTAVTIGGRVTFSDPNGDERADVLSAGELDGFVNIAPESIAPRISAQLSATRK